MSIDATMWAWAQPVSPTDKLVLLAVADRADEQSKCRPTMDRLESYTGLDSVTIQKSLAGLCRQRILQPEPHHNQYQLCGVNCREHR